MTTCVVVALLLLLLLLLQVTDESHLHQMWKSLSTIFSLFVELRTFFNLTKTKQKKHVKIINFILNVSKAKRAKPEIYNFRQAFYVFFQSIQKLRLSIFFTKILNFTLIRHFRKQDHLGTGKKSQNLTIEQKWLLKFFSTTTILLIMLSHFDIF